MSDKSAAILSFDGFEIEPERHLLRVAGVPVSLSSKAFEILVFLIENRGSVVSKSVLLDAVWRDQFVEENNLTVHIAALRKALGEKKGDNRYIVTVPGEGYKFVAEPVRPETHAIVIENRTVSKVVIEDSSPDDPVIGYLPGAPVNGWRWSWAVAAIVLVSIAGLLAYSFIDKGAGVAGGRFRSRVFATSGGVPHRVAISSDGTKVAYVQRQKGQDSLWIGELASGNSIQLLPSSDRLYSYVGFSPDGQNVYFTGRDQNHETWTLMRISAFGGAVQDVLVGIHSSPGFSPDGRQIAFIRKDGQSESGTIMTADSMTGRSERVLVGPDAEIGLAGTGVAWSPDGKIVAAIRMSNGECEIIGVDAVSGSYSTIDRGTCRENSNLAWMPDGSGLLATTSGGDASIDGAVKFVPFPSGQPIAITSDSQNYANFSLSVSKDARAALLQTRLDPAIWLSESGDPADARKVVDGSRVRLEGIGGLSIASDGRLLFVARSGKSISIWDMDADGNGQRQLTAAEGTSVDSQVKSTSDGRYLLFQSTRTGNTEIWRSNRDGSGAIQLSNGGTNDQPDVSPDGQTVIYRSTKDRQSTIWAVSIDGKNPRQLTKEQSSWPVFAFDGKRFACIYGRPVDAGDKKIAIFALGDPAPTEVLKIALNGVVHSRPAWSADDRSIVYKDLVSGLWRHDLSSGRPTPINGFDGLRVFSFEYSRTGQLVYSGGVQMREIVILEKN